MLPLGTEAGLDVRDRAPAPVGTVRRLDDAWVLRNWAVGDGRMVNWASRFLFCREPPKATGRFSSTPKPAVKPNPMFARPRPKKDALQPPPKKRKTTHAIEEITFDRDARADYLSGFHKRKVARIKEAQSIAAKKEREERIQIRRQV
jgi:hypothetical protein